MRDMAVRFDRKKQLRGWRGTVIAASLGWLLVIGCGKPDEQARCILPENVQLRVGDVVFRQGGGLESHAVRMMDSDGLYSHVGIVADTMGRLMVVHAVPGEPDYAGDPDRVKLDEIATFFSSVYAGKGEVARVADSVAAHRSAKVALETFRRGVLFDHDYDVSDTTRMYCTELVMYAYERAGIRLVVSEPHVVELPMLHAAVYYPSDIYQSRYLKSIIKF